MKSYFLLSVTLILLFTGCLTDSEKKRGSGVYLPIGHYFILNDIDVNNRYTQYFVVTSVSTWEFVEYGFDLNNSSLLCQITRQKGGYSVSADSVTLTMTLSAYGESISDCGLTQADFNAYPFSTADLPTEPFVVTLTSLTDSSFSGSDIFSGDGGQNTYLLTEPIVNYFGI